MIDHEYSFFIFQKDKKKNCGLLTHNIATTVIKVSQGTESKIKHVSKASHQTKIKSEWFFCLYQQIQRQLEKLTDLCHTGGH